MHACRAAACPAPARPPPPSLAGSGVTSTDVQIYGPYKPRTGHTGHMPSEKGAIGVYALTFHQLLQLRNSLYSRCVRCLTLLRLPESGTVVNCRATSLANGAKQRYSKISKALSESGKDKKLLFHYKHTFQHSLLPGKTPP